MLTSQNQNWKGKRMLGCLSRAQGATEYLVLLSVVLIIALVGVAMLGFFPGTASDSQATESQIYWRSASPIAIVETSVRLHPSGQEGYDYPYLKIRNNGNYPIQITKVLGAGQEISLMYCGSSAINISQCQRMRLSPGEESYFGSWVNGVQPDMQIVFRPMGSANSIYLEAESSSCRNSTSSGYSVINNFGFEYVQYVEGHPITKKQIGSKPLVIKCQ